MNGLDLTASDDETFGFLGPSGAGKTTTISMLTTLLRPTAGRAEVAGHDVAARPAEVRRRIGIVFQESTLDLDLTPAENLRFQADLCGLDRREARREISAMLDMTELSEHSRIPVRQFSTGLRRRPEIARGLLGTPGSFFLDEPTTGLDAQTRAAVWEHLTTLRRERGITVFFTTHQLEEAEHCDRIAIFGHGEMITQGSPAELRSVIGADLVVLRTEDDRRAVDALSDRFGLSAEPSRLSPGRLPRRPQQPRGLFDPGRPRRGLRGRPGQVRAVLRGAVRQAARGGGPGLSEAQLIAAGREAGITGGSFRKCVQDGTYTPWTAYVSDVAASRKVALAPTVMVDGDRIEVTGPDAAAAVKSGRKAPASRSRGRSGLRAVTGSVPVRGQRRPIEPERAPGASRVVTSGSSSRTMCLRQRLGEALLTSARAECRSSVAARSPRLTMPTGQPPCSTTGRRRTAYRRISPAA